MIDCVKRLRKIEQSQYSGSFSYQCSTEYRRYFSSVPLASQLHAYFTPDVLKSLISGITGHVILNSHWFDNLFKCFRDRCQNTDRPKPQVKEGLWIAIVLDSFRCWEIRKSWQYGWKYVLGQVEYRAKLILANFIRITFLI